MIHNVMIIMLIALTVFTLVIVYHWVFGDRDSRRYVEGVRHKVQDDD